MARHWKGMMWFGGSSGLAFIVALMTNHTAYGIGVLVVAAIGFTVYMVGEGGLKEPYGSRDPKA